MPKQPYNAGDEEQVKEKKTKIQLKRETELEHLRQICTDKRVRDFIWRMLEWCAPYTQSFTGNSETFFKEGKRKIGTELIRELDSADVKIYNLMRIEQSNGED